MASDNIVSFRRPRDDRRSYEEAVRGQQVEPWGTIRDYPERVRFVRPEPHNLYSSRAEQERIDRLVEDIRRDDRALFWQGMVKGFCIAVAYLTVIYFFWQLGRGAF